jgi:hypothetical protein
MVEEMQRPVVGFRLDGCRRLAVRGDEFGKVADTVPLPTGEVWEIHWRDGSMDLWFHRCQPPE